MSGKRYDELIEASRGKDEEQFKSYIKMLEDRVNEVLNLLREQMKLNEKIAKRYSTANYIFQVLVLVLTASIPLVNYIETSKILTISVGIIDTILIGLINLFKFREHQYIKQQTNQKLLQEYKHFVTARGDYANHSQGEALDIFLDRTDEIQNEGFQRSLTLEKSAQAHIDQKSPQ